MSLRTKVLIAAAGQRSRCRPTASAEPTVDAAKAIYQDLGLTQLTAMPSGRVVEPTATAATNFGYRTYEEINAGAAGAGRRQPGLREDQDRGPQVGPGPRRQVPGDLEQHRLGETQAKPVFFNMALIHGNEWAASEQAIEFIYDVINTSKTNPKVKALFDKVKFIAMPVVSPDGLALYRRQNANGVDMNRNYPFGWGSNIGVTFAQRGVGPGSEPEVQNTMDIVRENQVVALRHDAHRLARVLLPGPGDRRRPARRPGARSAASRSRWPTPPTTATPTSATRRTTTRPAARRSTGPTTRRAASP